MINLLIKNMMKYVAAARYYYVFNLLGFTASVACTLFIVIYIKNELSYDSFHTKADSIFRINSTLKIGDELEKTAGSPFPLAEAVRAEVPEVVEVARLLPSRDLVLKIEEDVFRVKDAFYVDSTFFKIFDFNLIEGGAKTCLSKPHTAVLTRSLQEKYFHGKNALGNIIYVGGNEQPHLITGVVDDPPSNSHFHFDILFSMYSPKITMATNKWEWNNFYTYLQLKDKDQASKVNETISAAIKPHLNSAVKDNFGISFDEFLKSGNQLGYTLQPINSIHLNSHFNDELESNADVIEIIVLGSMALLILLTAVTNYINYTTATSSARSKEITIKKVLGASRGQLIAQHIFDSFVFSVASLLLAIFLVMTFLKDFNLLMGKEILPQAVFSPELILFYFVLVSVVTILAGIFPGIHFIKFAPTSALRAEVFTQSRGGSNFRNALVFFQYFVSFILVVSSLIIYQQLDYVQNKSLGFDNKNVLVISIDNRLPQKRHVFKDEILKLSDVQSASITTNIPSYNHFFTRTLSNDKKNLKDIPVAWAEVDDSYFKTLQMEIQEGRVFSIDRASDSSAILLNEAAARILSVEGQLGDYLSYNNDEEKYQIIGIVKDFHFESFHNEIRPVAIKLVTTNDFRDFVLIKTRGKIDHEMIARVQGIWNTFLPGASFEYNVLEETGDALLDPDRKFARLINLFSILALIISIVGSSALASYVAEKSLKEISIRKVLGASSGHITFVLNRKFLVVILAAFLLAFPVAYYVANKWLENFAFRVNFSVGMFVGGCIFVTLLSLVFINFQYYRAIRSNPVKYIR